MALLIQVTNGEPKLIAHGSPQEMQTLCGQVQSGCERVEVWDSRKGIIATMKPLAAARAAAYEASKALQSIPIAASNAQQVASDLARAAADADAEVARANERKADADKARDLALAKAEALAKQSDPDPEPKAKAKAK